MPKENQECIEELITEKEKELLKSLSQVNLGESVASNTDEKKLAELLDDINAKCTSITNNCSHINSVVDLLLSENSENIMEKLENIEKSIAPVSKHEKAIQKYANILTQLEKNVSRIEEKKIFYKKANKAVVSFFTSLFSKSGRTPPDLFVTHQPDFDLDAALEDIKRL